MVFKYTCCLTQQPLPFPSFIYLSFIQQVFIEYNVCQALCRCWGWSSHLEMYPQKITREIPSPHPRPSFWSWPVFPSSLTQTDSRLHRSLWCDPRGLGSRRREQGGRVETGCGVEGCLVESILSFPQHPFSCSILLSHKAWKAEQLVLQTETVSGSFPALGPI